MVPAKMKVIEMDNALLEDYVTRCIQTVKDEKKEGTWIYGQGKGIEDALKLVTNENLPFVMKMAILGLRHINDDNKEPFLTKSNTRGYICGYASGLTDAIKIITGERIEYINLL